MVCACVYASVSYSLCPNFSHTFLSFTSTEHFRILVYCVAACDVDTQRNDDVLEYNSLFDTHASVQ